jgi:hypothetical protein
MTQPMRPVKTFVLRLWREPGDPETEAGWRGLIHPLDVQGGVSNKVPFHGMENLIAALRQSLAVTETAATPQSAIEREQPSAGADRNGTV